MPQNKDTRDFTFDRSEAIEIDLEGLAADLSTTVLEGDHQIRVNRINAFTGSPDNVQSLNAPGNFVPLTDNMPEDAFLIAKALDHIRSIGPALGFTSGQAAEFVPDPYIKKTSSGTRIVSLQQQYRGVPVWFMGRSVIFNERGAITDTTGTNVDLRANLETFPSTTIEAAVTAAAEYMTSPGNDKNPWTGNPLPDIHIDIDMYQPKVLGRIGLPSQPSVISAGPFGESIPAHLVFYYRGRDTRLGWHFLISTPNFEEQYEIIVEADSRTKDKAKPEVLYAQNTSNHIAVRGAVWTHNPGVNQQRTLIDFPPDPIHYPIDVSVIKSTGEFPRPWVGETSTTRGNNTKAVSGNSDDSLPGNTVDGILSFDPGDANALGDDQKVLNIFYFCNYMHDFFYLLGFDEKHGNFQEINFTGFGTGRDPVLARAHPGEKNGQANMSVRADGESPVMDMGIVKTAHGDRHTAFDSDVVFHEFTHGVSNRLVGRRLDVYALQEAQSKGMGEGWSDYVAITIQNCTSLMKDPAAIERTITGDWVTGRPGGIRLAPYTDSYPATFGKVGNGLYKGPHAIGEIWCAALMKLNRDFGTALNDKIKGHQIGWQIVVDGLKLTASNPNFLIARDAILRALSDLKTSGSLSEGEFTDLNRAAWKAFAHFGMGRNASCVGAGLQGINEDFDVPQDI